MTKKNRIEIGIILGAFALMLAMRFIGIPVTAVLILTLISLVVLFRTDNKKVEIVSAAMILPLFVLSPIWMFANFVLAYVAVNTWKYAKSKRARGVFAVLSAASFLGVPWIAVVSISSPFVYKDSMEELREELLVLEENRGAIIEDVKEFAQSLEGRDVGIIYTKLGQMDGIKGGYLRNDPLGRFLFEHAYDPGTLFMKEGHDSVIVSGLANVVKANAHAVFFDIPLRQRNVRSRDEAFAKKMGMSMDEFEAADRLKLLLENQKLWDDALDYEGSHMLHCLINDEGEIISMSIWPSFTQMEIKDKEEFAPLRKACLEISDEKKLAEFPSYEEHSEAWRSGSTAKTERPEIILPEVLPL